MPSVKLFLASQARSIDQYKNLKSKVLKCCTNIYFNSQCLKNEVIVDGIITNCVTCMSGAQTSWLISLHTPMAKI